MDEGKFKKYIGKDVLLLLRPLFVVMLHNPAWLLFMADIKHALHLNLALSTNTQPVPSNQYHNATLKYGALFRKTTNNAT
jgi:hypothetical protein